MLGEEGQLFGLQEVKSYSESSRSHIALTYDGSNAVGNWSLESIHPGRELNKPVPLFKKLDSSVAEYELNRLKGS